MEEEEFFKKQIGKMINQANYAPIEDFDNLSSADMNHIMYDTFGKESCLQINTNIPKEILDQVPFLQLELDYFKILGESKELKLTPKGNLLVKTCKTLYEPKHISDFGLEKIGYKLNQESKCISIVTMKLIATVANLTKKRNNKMSLTKKGQKLYYHDDHSSLFRILFESYFKEYNMGYHDGYGEHFEIQRTIGYTFYLLLQYGKEFRPIEFYSEKVLKAFPMLLHPFMRSSFRTPKEEMTSCYQLRIFKRYLDWFGLVKIESDDKFLDKNVQVKATDIYFKIFRLEKNNFQFSRGGEVN